MSESISLLRKQMKAKQITRIISMKQGRGLDAIVAEYIFGFQVESWEDQEEGGDSDYWFRLPTVGRVREKQEMERVPNYSTVVYAALQILPKFKHWSIQSGAEGKGIEAYLSNSSNARVADGLPLLHNVTILNFPSLPEAICKAGLIAIVESNKMIDKLLGD